MPDGTLTAIKEGLGVAVIIAQPGAQVAGAYSPATGGVALVNGKDTATRRRFTPQERAAAAQARLAVSPALPHTSPHSSTQTSSPNG